MMLQMIRNKTVEKTSYPLKSEIMWPLAQQTAPPKHYYEMLWMHQTQSRLTIFKKKTAGRKSRLTVESVEWNDENDVRYLLGDINFIPCCWGPCCLRFTPPSHIRLLGLVFTAFTLEGIIIHFIYALLAKVFFFFFLVI